MGIIQYLNNNSICIIALVLIGLQFVACQRSKNMLNEKLNIEITQYAFDNNLKDAKIPPSISNNGDLQLTRVNRNLTIECKGLDPVVWRFKGHTAPIQVNLTAFRRHVKDRDEFIAVLFIVRVSSQLSGTWSCGFIKDEINEQNHNAKSINIYAGEHSYRGEDPYFLEYGKGFDLFGQLGESIILPCNSYNSSIQAQLAKRVGDRYVDLDSNVNWLNYHASMGFNLTLFENQIEKSPFGKYICYNKGLLQKTFDRVIIRLHEKFDIVVDPPVETVEVIFGSWMNVSCSSRDPSLRVEIFHAFPPERVRVFPNTFQSSNHHQISFTDFPLQDEGTVICRAFRLSNKEEVFQHSWSYHVVSEMDVKRRGWKYYFSARLLEHWYACWVRSSNVPSIAFVQCTSPMECDVRSSCFNLENRCDSVKPQVCSGGCARIPLRDTPGILSCNGEGVNNSRVELFIGASGNTHNKTKNLEKDLLFATHNVENGSYVGTVVDLYCRGSSFKFARGFYWIINLLHRNSTIQTLRIDKDTQDKHNNITTVLEFMEVFDHGRGLVTLTAKLIPRSILLTHISCIAPHWESRDSTRFTLNITVAVPTPPRFQSSADDGENFNLGDVNRELRCNAFGIPKPTIVWMKDGKSIQHRNIDIINDGDTLHFDEITNAHHGTYECIASNPGGTNRKTFTISVTNSKQRIILAVVIPGVIFILILIIVLGLFWRRIQHQKALLRNLTDAEIEEFLYGNPSAISGSEDTNKQGHLLAYNTDYEFPKEYLDILMEEKLGSGAYGLVIKGRARGLFPGEEETLVAIKTLQPNADITNFKALLIELKIMSVIGRHAHIINLLGACTTDIRQREVFIIVEYCENGSLEKFLKSHRCDFATYHDSVRYSTEPKRETVLYANTQEIHSTKINLQTLLRWSYEIAKGMEYLASKKVIHGDVAARNILLTDKLFVKIGDFGLSRQLYEYTNYVKKQQAPLPWRWMAIESLCDMEFSHKSDVWAYGVTIWEIFSLGEIPYPGTNWTEDFVRKLRQGNRPPKPDLAEEAVYSIMIECWRYEANDRPSFAELSQSFKTHLHQMGLSIQEPPIPQTRQKFNLKLHNSNYGVIKQDGEMSQKIE